MENSRNQMLMASRLGDGRVVFLAAAGRWVEAIAEGRVATDEASAAQLLAEGKADEARNRVVDPYLVEIADTGGRRRPVVWREAIRAEGPTIRTDLSVVESAASVARDKTGRTLSRSGRKFTE
jgi:predicted transcriptional regulator